jgi:hypothetical protein
MYGLLRSAGSSGGPRSLLGRQGRADRATGGLGDAFTPQVEAAWVEAETILATVMKDDAVA